jgi:hypothetical protein
MCMCVGGEGGVGERGKAGVSVGGLRWGGKRREGKDSLCLRFLFMCSHSLAPPPLYAYTGSRERPIRTLHEGTLHNTTTDPRARWTGGGARALCPGTHLRQASERRRYMLPRHLLDVDEPRLRDGAVLPISILSWSPMAVAVCERCWRRWIAAAELGTRCPFRVPAYLGASPALFFWTRHSSAQRRYVWTTCRVSVVSEQFLRRLGLHSGLAATNLAAQ